jgi:DNA integrity scanning protein DisA with diadenylate cyclase activity
VARAAAGLSADRHGALIVLQRDTGLEDTAESGVMLHADLSADLLRTIFTPRSPLHDGAVIIREETIIAAGALLPLAETTIHTERFGTRHRAALGITESTDAVVVVVSEENAQVSLVERARIVRNLNEAQLARALRTLLTPQSGRTMLSRRAGEVRTAGGRAPTFADLGRIVGRRNGQHPDAVRPADVPSPTVPVAPLRATVDDPPTSPADDVRVPAPRDADPAAAEPSAARAPR